MWKIIGAIVVLTLIILFISFNIENVSDISFIFFTAVNIPVYLTIFFSLLIGALAMLPFALGYRRKKKKDQSIAALEKEINSSFDKQFANNDKKGKKKKKAEKKNSDIDISPAQPTDTPSS